MADLSVPASANINRVDPRLFDILQEAAAQFPERVSVTAHGGDNGRPGDSEHGKGRAIDIQIYDAQGNPIPNYQNGAAFRTYEQFAQTARRIQQERYPGLSNDFRWGGYFSGPPGKYGAADLMHFDLGGLDGRQMAGGNWATGLTAAQRRLYPQADSIGLTMPQNGTEAIAAATGSPMPQPRPTSALAFNGGDALSQTGSPVAHPTAASAANAGLSGDDVLRMYLTAPAASPASGTAAQPAAAPSTPAAASGALSGDDVLKLYLTAPQAPAGGQMAAPGTPAAPGATGRLLGPASSSVGAFFEGAANGIPIVGPAIQSGLNKAAAAVRAIRRDEPYSQALNEVQGEVASDAAAHPALTTAGNVAGAVAGTAPLAVAAPEAFGISKASLPVNMLIGAGTGGAIGAADAGVRSGFNPGQTLEGGAIGFGAGALGPVAGRIVGAGVNKLIGTARDFMPASAATQRMLGAIADSSSTPAEVANALMQNPRLAPVDVNPNLLHMGMGLAADGGAPRATISNFVTNRTASAPATVEGAYDAALGATPDVQGILNDLRWREAGNAPNLGTVKGAINEAMGPAANPKAVLDNIVVTRAQESAPLYAKALAQPVVWTNRLQQFLDDPVVQAGLAKGARIQRMESLAAGEPFNPTDYAIKDFDAAGDPVIGTTPNMRTLNVVKKGLDAMVSDAKDPVTGRLSEEGRAIDQVRKAFVGELDSINPDYAAARKAWEGPTKVHAAFAKGLSVFQNRGGMSGVETTPGALTDWLAKASPAEKDALKAGARASIEQQMSAAPDPAKKIGNLATLEANQQKLEAILGKGPADKLFQQLRATYTDPIGEAFAKGINIFSNRSGIAGLEDRPEALKAWMAHASPNEVAALRQGIRTAVDQRIGSVRNAALAGEAIPAANLNADKLEVVLGKQEADKLIGTLNDEQRMGRTHGMLMSGSQTAARESAKSAIAVPDVGPLRGMSMPIGFAGMAGLTGHPYAVGGSLLYGAARKGTEVLARLAAQRRNALLAEWLTATGENANGPMNRLMAAEANPPRSPVIAGAGANLLTNAAGRQLRQNLLMRRFPLSSDAATSAEE